MSASATPHSSPRIETRLGTAELTRTAMKGLDLSPVVAELEEAANNGPARGAALMDLSAIEQLRGNLERGLRYQELALQQCQIYETHSTAEPDLDVLVLAAPIHMGGNTPIEFLIANTSIRQRTLYLSEEHQLPEKLLEHDVIFVAAPSDNDQNRGHLEKIYESLDSFDRPILNNPRAIVGFERDELVLSAGQVPGVRLPETFRASRTDLIARCVSKTWSTSPFAKLGAPFIIRPVGSHAGRDLEKLSTVEEIAEYLQRCSDDDFFISSFIDHSSDDGLFRKYRIIFVDGRPFPCHMKSDWKRGSS